MHTIGIGRPWTRRIVPGVDAIVEKPIFRSHNCNDVNLVQRQYGLQDVPERVNGREVGVSLPIMGLGSRGGGDQAFRGVQPTKG